MTFFYGLQMRVVVEPYAPTLWVYIKKCSVHNKHLITPNPNP